MAHQEPSIADLVKGALHDAQDLVRGEIALAKAEAREEAGRLAAGVAALAAAAVVALIALVLLMTTLAWALADVFAWPAWAGFGIVTLLSLVIAGVLAAVGKSRMTSARRMPRTVDTLKENMEWMRARTS